MRYIFYHYNHFGTLVFDYYDEETHVSQSYMFYTLKQAVSCLLYTSDAADDQ